MQCLGELTLGHRPYRSELVATVEERVPERARLEQRLGVASFAERVHRHALHFGVEEKLELACLMRGPIIGNHR